MVAEEEEKEATRSAAAKMDLNWIFMRVGQLIGERLSVGCSMHWAHCALSR